MSATGDKLLSLHNSFDGRASGEACKFRQKGRRWKFGDICLKSCTVAAIVGPRWHGLDPCLVLLWTVAVKVFESDDYRQRFHRGDHTRWMVRLPIEPAPVCTLELQKY